MPRNVTVLIDEPEQLSRQRLSVVQREAYQLVTTQVFGNGRHDKYHIKYP